MLTVILAALTGCKSTETEAQVDTSDIIKKMAPELPELPPWPHLEWAYQDRRYSISEADADKILDYWENQVPAYLHELEVYREKLDVVLEKL